MKAFSWFLLSCVLCGCAARYRPMPVNQTRVQSFAEVDDFEMGYRNNVLRDTGNKKYAKKAARKNISLVVVEFTNHSSRPITLRET